MNFARRELAENVYKRNPIELLASGVGDLVKLDLDPTVLVGRGAGGALGRLPGH